MGEAAYRTVHISDLPPAVEPEPGSYEWKPVRHHLGVRAFGVNLFVAPSSGDWVIEQHTETEDSGTRHEELFYVSSGHATFLVDGEEIDAPAGTLVFVPDPAVSRGARARDAGTTVLAVGAEPGASYSVSPWEKKYFE